MSTPEVCEAVEKLSAILAAEPAKARAKSMATARLTEGLKCEVTGPRNERVSPGLGSWRTKVKIAGNADPQALRDLVAWSDAHSPVGCTVRNASPSALDVEVI